MLLKKHPIGNTRVYDLKRTINTHLIQSDFNKVTYPYKHLLRVHYKQPEQLVQIPSNRNYPEFKMLRGSGSEEMVMRSMLFFIEKAEIPDNTRLWIEAFHINPYAYLEKEWFFENYSKKAILCVQRENIEYSKFELRPKRQKVDDKHTFKWEFRPGEMVLFDADDTFQRYTHMDFTTEQGFQDLLVFTTS